MYNWLKLFAHCWTPQSSIIPTWHSGSRQSFATNIKMQFRWHFRMGRVSKSGSDLEPKLYNQKVCQIPNRFLVQLPDQMGITELHTKWCQFGGTSTSSACLWSRLIAKSLSWVALSPEQRLISNHLILTKIEINWSSTHCPPPIKLGREEAHTNQNSLLCSYNLIRIGFWSSRSPPCPLNVQPTFGQPHRSGKPVQNLIDYFWNPSTKQYTTPSKTKIFGPFSLCKSR